VNDTVSLVNAGGILSCWSRLCHQLCSTSEKWRLLAVSYNLFAGCKQGQFVSVYEDKSM